MTKEDHSTVVDLMSIFCYQEIRVYFGWSRPGLSRHSFHPEMKSNSLDIMNATLKRPEMIQYVHWISCMLFGTFQDRDKQWDFFGLATEVSAELVRK